MSGLNIKGLLEKIKPELLEIVKQEVGTRFAKLKGFDNLLVGRDLGNIFKEGHIYSVTETLGTIIIKDLGEHSFMKDYAGKTYPDIIADGSYYVTKDEKKILLDK